MEFVGGTPALQVLLVAVIFLAVLMEVKTGGSLRRASSSAVSI